MDFCWIYWCRKKGKVKYPSIDTCQVLESQKDITVEHKRSQVQSPVQVISLLNLFCSFLYTITANIANFVLRKTSIDFSRHLWCRIWQLINLHCWKWSLQNLDLPHAKTWTRSTYLCTPLRLYSIHSVSDTGSPRLGLFPPEAWSR